MAGAAIEVLETGLAEALLTIDGIANAPTQELAEGIGRLVQTQTRRRIEEEKTSPQGEAWQPNIAGTSILYASGELARSIDYEASADSVEVGSGLVYARIHQEGGKIEPKNGDALAFMIGNQFVVTKSVTMPRRQYLGLSADNQDEIVQTAEEWLQGLTA